MDESFPAMSEDRMTSGQSSSRQVMQRTPMNQKGEL
jgi:hypothetical protein